MRLTKEHAAYDNLPAKQSRWDLNPTSSPNLAHPINHTFGSVRHRLVTLSQKPGQNRKVLHWILRTFRVGLNIDNVGRRMPGKILLKDAPSPRQYPATRIETGDWSAEDITRERKRFDVTRGRASLSV